MLPTIKAEGRIVKPLKRTADGWLCFLLDCADQDDVCHLWCEIDDVGLVDQIMHESPSASQATITGVLAYRPGSIHPLVYVDEFHATEWAYR